ncbi:MAG: class I SAM-dependent RNA methyltransferase [Clostridia bacterium]|nr:class I SAM-dependent RNA methyltransferase [Clostridia bacterium]
MTDFKLIATAAFGLEGIVSRELDWLGAADKTAENGRVRFSGDLRMVARANLWLRTADRVLILLAEGKVTTFEELFQLVSQIPFEELMPADACFPVTGKSVKSTLFSVPDCQAITKKAVVERLKKHYGLDWFPETGPKYKLEVSILNDVAMITLDTSGAGLHKRGYRKETGKAPIRETLAAGMVLVSRWKKDRALIDPFCGTGTIPIEAAMIARNIAPGLRRHFDFEKWSCFDGNIILEERKRAESMIDRETELKISGSDIDYFAVKQAMDNATFMGVDADITFQKLDFRAVLSGAKYGFIITNPPYGERLGEEKEIRELYRAMGEHFKKFPTWSFYVITSYPEFEKSFGRRADKKRKLYNGMLQCNFYQLYGPKPVRRDAPAAEPETHGEETDQ